MRKYDSVQIINFILSFTVFLVFGRPDACADVLPQDHVWKCGRYTVRGKLKTEVGNVSRFSFAVDSKAEQIISIRKIPFEVKSQYHGKLIEADIQISKVGKSEDTVAHWNGNPKRVTRMEALDLPIVKSNTGSCDDPGR